MAIAGSSPRVAMFQVLVAGVVVLFAVQQYFASVRQEGALKSMSSQLSSVQHFIQEATKPVQMQVQANQAPPSSTYAHGNLYLGDGMVFCYVQTLRLHMVLEGTDRGMTPHLCRGLGWEPDIAQVLARLVKPGYRVLDVGTNVGYYTLMFAQIVGPTGKIMGIEANPRMFELAQRTLEFNGYLHHTVELLHRAAYYADNKVLKMTAWRDRPLNNFVTEVGADDPRVQYSGMKDHMGPKMSEVPTVTIDTAVAAWDKLDFIKIDVEGAEAQVYGGLNKTIARFPNLTIVMEINSIRMGEPAKAFYEQIQRDFPRLQRIVGTRIVDTSVQELLDNRQGDDLLVLRRTGFDSGR